MKYALRPNEKHADAVLRYRELYSEASYCCVPVKVGEAYVDVPNAITLEQERLLLEVFYVDELTGWKGYQWIDISLYTVDNLLDMIKIHLDLKRKYTPTITEGRRGLKYYEAIGYPSFKAMANGIRAQQRRRNQSI